MDMRLLIISFMLLQTLFSFDLPSVDQMTLEEKVGQLLMVHFKGNQINEEAIGLIKQVHVGSIIYYTWSNELSSPLQIKTLSHQLQQAASETRLSIPLLIAADQEGGLVTRFSEGFTLFPGNLALGSTHDPNLAWQSSYIMGKEMQEVGVNFVLGPVVDINSESKNPVIGIRSFGQTASEVIAFSHQALQGFHQAGMATCIKHFPGHGSVTTDSHYDLPLLSKSLSELEQEELAPFANLAAQTDAVMTGHLMTLALDSDHCTTLSQKSINYLRDHLHFRGVVITDSLAMKGVLKQYQTSTDTAVEALIAGCDLLCLGGRHLIEGFSDDISHLQSIQYIHKHIVESVKQGKITPERIDEAVTRVLQLKKKCFSEPAAPLQKEVSHLQTQEERQAIASNIAQLSLKIVQDDPRLFNTLDSKKIAFIAPVQLEKVVTEQPFLLLGKSATSLFFNPEITLEEKRLEQALAAYEVFIIFTMSAWKNDAQSAFVSHLMKLKKPVILIATKEPLDTELFPQANAALHAFSPTAPSLHAVYLYLKQRCQK
ncbi:MAG: glycoside hydrolase family 3 protein [Candidatus Rhabdochlamydia sp.]